jgi:hypothetical protein
VGETPTGSLITQRSQVRILSPLFCPRCYGLSISVASRSTGVAGGPDEVVTGRGPLTRRCDDRAAPARHAFAALTVDAATSWYSLAVCTAMLVQSNSEMARCRPASPIASARS